MFRCSKCKGEFADEQRAAGYAQCRECRAAYVNAWRNAHPGRNAELCRARAARDPERVKREQAEWRARPGNAEKARAKSQVWYRDNRERALAWAREHYDRAKAARKRWSRKHSLSDYFRSELQEIYIKCPSGMEVDHIEPLNGGEKFCGLHVPWNLQYLTPSDNRSKKNKLPHEWASV